MTQQLQPRCLSARAMQWTVQQPKQAPSRPPLSSAPRDTRRWDTEGRLLLLPPPLPATWVRAFPTRRQPFHISSPALKALILPLLRSHVSVSTPFLWLKTVKNWEAVEILDPPCKLTKVPVTTAWRLADDTAVLGQRRGTYHAQHGRDGGTVRALAPLLPPRPRRQACGGAQVYAAQAVGSH